MKWLTKFCIVSSLVGVSVWARAAGLSTTFVDVVVKSVPVGTVWNVRGPEGKGLVIKNLGDAPLRVSVEAVVPTAQQLKAGAQAIPDISWLHFDSPIVTLPPRSEKEVRITVKVPKRQEFRHKKYQVMVWSRGENIESHGLSLNAGLLSRLRIYTAP